MAAQGRLAKILEQEYKTKGFVTGSLTGGGKRLREILDLRNVLFSGGGIGSTIGKKIFGKGYSAVSDRSSASKLSSPMMGFSKESIEILSSIKSDTRTTAKNSMILPALARDMNVMRQNIVKLVKLSGGQAATKADAFFLRSKERETAYEAQFNRRTPTAVTQKPTESKKGGLLAGLAGLIGLMIPAIANAMQFGFKGLKTTFDVLSGTVGELFSTIKFLADKIVDLGLNLLGLKTALSMLNNNPLSPNRPTQPPPPNSKDADKSKGTLGRAAAATAGAAGAAGSRMSKSSSGGRSARASQKASSRFGNTKAGGLTISGAQSKDTGKFAKFLDRIKAHPKLGSAVAKRILAAVGGVFVPGPGWIWTVLSLGSLAFFAYEIYEVYKEVFGDEDKSPTNLKQEQNLMANLIYDRFREAGFSDAQARGAVANAVAESKLDPNAQNEKGEDSVGLFQMNRNGGLGKGYSVEQLKDPETNIRLAIEAAKNSKMFKSATTMEEATEGFMKEVERPKDQSSSAVQKRINFGLAMQGSELGSRVNYASTDLANAQRAMGTGQSSTVIQQDNSVKNVQNQSSGSVSSTYNDDWNNLFNAAV